MQKYNKGNYNIVITLKGQQSFAIKTAEGCTNTNLGIVKELTNK